jgi:hypothetical protein
MPLTHLSLMHRTRFQRLIPSCSVRITTEFGLSKAYSFILCLNHHWIRTTKGIFLHALSESPMDSDFQRQVPSCSVRITTCFGLSKASSFMLCPNHHWIRTTKYKFLHALSEISNLIFKSVFKNHLRFIEICRYK